MTLYLNGAVFGEDSEIALGSDNQIIQSGETAELKAMVLDGNHNPVVGETVYFFEQFTPSLDLTGDKQIIQSNEHLTLSAKLKDEDGSLVTGATVYFFVEE